MKMFTQKGKKPFRQDSVICESQIIKKKWIIRSD